MQNNYMQIFIAMPTLFANCFFNICKWRRVTLIILLNCLIYIIQMFWLVCKSH